MSVDLTTIAADVKTRYSPTFIDSMVYPRKPLFAALKKMKDMGGSPFRQPVVYENPQAVSADFATSQTQSASTSSKVVAFDVTRVKRYGTARIDGETIEATKGDQNAFFAALSSEIDRTMKAVGRRIAADVYRSGFGDIGRVSNSSFATPALTLTLASDIANFAKDMIVVTSATQNGTPKAGTLTVTGVDRNTGIVTMTANLSTGIATIAQNDFIFPQGDRDSSGNKLCIAGLEAWIPTVAPTSTLFFNVDRTSDSRLGGLRYDGTAQPIEEAIIDGAALAGREGAQLDMGFMNPVTFGNLVKALGTKVQYVDMVAGDAKVGFRGIRLYTPAGTVDFYPDQDCPSNRIYMLQMNTWMLGSLGDVPRIIGWDDNQVLRVSNADAVECRTGCYANLICKAPGWNINVQV
jgi:hypothetical protein